MTSIPQKPKKKRPICPTCKQEIQDEFLDATNELEKQIALELRNTKIDSLIKHSYLLTKWQRDFLDGIRYRKELSKKQSETLDSIWAQKIEYVPDLLPKPLAFDADDFP